VTAAVVRRWKRAPYLAAGWFWFLGALVPAIGIVQVGMQARADRFVYVPIVGLFVAAVWGLGEFAPRPRVAAAVAGVLLAAFAARSWHQLGYWRDSVSLFRQNLEVTSDDNMVAHNNLGTSLLDRGQVDEAIAHFRTVARLSPGDHVCRKNLGLACIKQGRLGEALAAFNESLRINPHYAEGWYNRAVLLRDLGRIPEAERDFRQALAGKLPGQLSSWARNHLGTLLAGRTKFEEAVAEFHRSIQDDPGFGAPRRNLAVVLAHNGRNPEAVDQLRKLLAFQPSDQAASRMLSRLEAGLTP
jgi:Flp pilus assembly protein TadD